MDITVLAIDAYGPAVGNDHVFWGIVIILVIIACICIGRLLFGPEPWDQGAEYRRRTRY